MPAPPAKAEISADYPNPSNATARAGFGKLWDYVTGLLGLTGSAAEARAALGLGTLSYRNRVINGGFAVNQRAVSGTVGLSAGAYGHDLWRAGAGGCTYTFSASAGETSIAISAGTLQQVIEGLDMPAGDVVLSWTGTATARIGSGSYAASPVTATAIGGANLTIEFSTGTVGRVQLEVGAVPTQYERRPIALEFQLCQRFYRVVAVGYNGYASSIGVTYGGSVNIPPMRITPTVAFLVDNEVSNFPTGSLNVVAVSPSWVKYSKAATGTGPAYYASSFSASAEF